MGRNDPEAPLAPKPLPHKHPEQQMKKPPAQTSAAAKTATTKQKATQKPNSKPAIDRKKVSPEKKASTTKKPSAHLRQLDAAVNTDSEILTGLKRMKLKTAAFTTIGDIQVQASAATNTSVDTRNVIDALRTEDEDTTQSVWTLADVAKRLTKQSSSSKTATKWQDLLNHEEAKMGINARRQVEESVARLEASIEKLRGLCVHAAVPLF